MAVLLSSPLSSPSDEATITTANTIAPCLRSPALPPSLTTAPLPNPKSINISSSPNSSAPPIRIVTELLHQRDLPHSPSPAGSSAALSRPLCPARPLRRMSSTGTNKLRLPPSQLLTSIDQSSRRSNPFGIDRTPLEGSLDDILIGGECGIPNGGQSSDHEPLNDPGSRIAHHLSLVLRHSFNVSSPHPITTASPPPSSHSPSSPTSRPFPSPLATTSRPILATPSGDSLKYKVSLTSLSSFAASNTTDEDTYPEEIDDVEEDAGSQVSGASSSSSFAKHITSSTTWPSSRSLPQPLNALGSPSSHRPQISSPLSISRPYLLTLLDTWSFDANSLSTVQIRTCLHILLSTYLRYAPGFSRELILLGVADPEHSLRGLVDNLEFAYDPRNAYHNFRHAVDVVQAVYNILSSEGVVPPLGWVLKKETPGNEDRTWCPRPVGRLGRALDPISIWALLLAAAGHDVGHPGLSNAFMVNARTPIAHVFPDGAVLENFHRITFTRMLRDHGFQKLVDGHLGFRKVLTGAVLATDMGRHFPIVEELKTLALKWETTPEHSEQPFDEALSEKVLITAGLIKCGDISNSAALEVNLNLPVSVVTLDPAEKRAQAKSQIGFTTLFVLPLFTVMEQLSRRSFRSFVDNCQLGLRTWQSVVEKIDSDLRLKTGPSCTLPKSSFESSHPGNGPNGDVCSENLHSIRSESPSLTPNAKSSSVPSDILSISPTSTHPVPNLFPPISPPTSLIPLPLGSPNRNLSCVTSLPRLSDHPPPSDSPAPIPQQPSQDGDDAHLTPRPAHTGWWAATTDCLLSGSSAEDTAPSSVSSSSVWTIRDGRGSSSRLPDLALQNDSSDLSQDADSEQDTTMVMPLELESLSPRHSLKINVISSDEPSPQPAYRHGCPPYDDGKPPSTADDSSLSSFGSHSSPPRSPYFTPGVSSASSVESTGDPTDSHVGSAESSTASRSSRRQKAHVSPVTDAHNLQAIFRSRDKGMSVDFGLSRRALMRSSLPLRKKTYSPYMINQQLACARGCGKVTVKCVKCAAESKRKMYRSLSLAKPAAHHTDTCESGQHHDQESKGRGVEPFLNQNHGLPNAPFKKPGKTLVRFSDLPSSSPSPPCRTSLSSEHNWPPCPFRPV